ncbi:MAG: ATP-binding protein [Aureliella sp.]
MANREEPDWTWSLLKTIPSSKDEGHKLVDELRTALTDEGWDGSDFFHVQMAAEEALINAITHGNKEDPTKTVELEFRVSDQTAFLRFKDQGEGFNPEDLPDPTADENLDVIHGRGVFLIRELMSEIEYNESGNEVRMWKHRTKEPAEA